MIAPKQIRAILVVLLLGWTSISTGQLQHVEPPNWWVGLKDTSLQLLLHGQELKNAEISINSDALNLLQVHYADSPNYLFLDLKISKDANPGMVPIILTKANGRTETIMYELKARNPVSESLKGFNSEDVVYLITPDRFSNGDPENDSFDYLREQGTDRSEDYARHGGDIRGIINNLSYIAGMGFTAIWSSPLLINDMPEQSYHGYAITDYYRVDPRFGTLEDYIALADKARERGIKLVMDQVVNHCGLYHWWMDDLPFEDWLNYQETVGADTTITTNHRRTVNQDTYASGADREKMQQGWFVSAMPDLNQRNPMMAQYLIQNSIWWIETLGLGGIRQDTYPYPDKHFLASWAGRIMEEYPGFSIVGEEWSYNPLVVGYWQDGAFNRDGYKSNLNSIMDFPLQRELVRSLKEPEGWDTGLNRLYEAVANDFYYADPKAMMLFPDNHDMDRIYTQLDWDLEATKMAVAFIAVAPRIPQFYYGTEVLLENSDKPGDHGLIRTDMPGGWEGDKVNIFERYNMSDRSVSMQAFMKKVLIFRKNASAVHNGKTVHFAPENGVYFIFRILRGEVVVLVLNKNNEPVTINLDRFSEIGLDGRNLMDVLSQTEISWDQVLELNGRGPYIFSTK